MKRYFFILTIILILTGLLGYPSMILAQWEHKADMPTARCCLDAVVVNRLIYAIGGAREYAFPVAFAPMANLEIYNPQTDKWSKGPDMLTPRHSFVAGAVGGKIYVVGGAGELKRRGKVLGVSIKTIEVFDPATNTWQKHADMDVKWVRNNSGGAVLDGKIYIIGGAVSVGGGGEVSLTTIYDPATNTWSEGPPLNEGRGPVATASVLNGKIYAIGGWRREKEKKPGEGVGGRDPEQNDMHNTEELDPAANVWVQKADMPTGRYVLAPKSAAVGGKIYVMGGEGKAQGLTVVEAYDPATDTWEQKQKMPTSRRQFATAVAVQGRIYVIGGVNAQDKLLASVDEYTADGWPFAVSPQGKLATVWGRIKAAD